MVKNYKLVKDALNDPVADAKLSRTLLADEWDSLAAGGRKELTSLYRYCFTGQGSDTAGSIPGEGIVGLLEMVGAETLGLEAAVEVFERLARGRVCATADVTTDLSGTDRIAVAYCAAWLSVSGGKSLCYQLPAMVSKRRISAGETA